MTDIELSEIRARCEAATPGPWAFDDRPFGDGLRIVGHSEGMVMDDGSAGGEYAETTTIENMRFICAAKEDIPALLAHIDEQRAEIEYLKRTIGYIAVAFSDFTMNWDVPSVNAEMEIAEAFTLAKKPDKDCEWLTINQYVDGAMEILGERGIAK